MTIAPSQCEVVGAAIRRYWRTGAEGKKNKERGRLFGLGVGYSNLLSTFLFFWAILYLLGGGGWNGN